MRIYITIFTFFLAFNISSSQTKLKNNAKKKVIINLDSTTLDNLVSDSLNHQLISIDKETLDEFAKIKKLSSPEDSLSIQLKRNQSETSEYTNKYKWWTFWGMPFLTLFPLFFTLYQWRKSQIQLEKSESERINDLKEQEEQNRINQYYQKIKDDQITIEEILSYCSSNSRVSSQATFLAMKFQNCIDYSILPEEYHFHENHAKRVLINFFVMDADFMKINHLALHRELLTNLPRMEVAFKEMRDAELNFVFQRYQKAISTILNSEISNYYGQLIDFKLGRGNKPRKEDFEKPDLVLIADVIIANLKRLNTILINHDMKYGVQNLSKIAYETDDFFITLIKE